MRLARLRSEWMLVMSLLAACGGGGGGGGNGGGPPPPLTASRTYRAIAGVSMGGYGALNLGTKHRDLFATIGSLGGPVDLRQLLRDNIADDLEVKAQTAIPRNVGDDFTFDHLPPYPDRDSRISQFQDLVIAFGNPFLHNPDPARLYLASDSEPARLLRDDRFDSFTLTGDPRGFLDGGDANANGVRETSEAPTQPVDVLLLARGSAPALSGGVPGQLVGNRELVDLDGDGVYDVGDGIVVNYSEPFTDTNGNFERDAGEPFEDVGLDGVAGTGDFGEGNGQFDYDPDRAHVLAEDPASRIAAESATDVATQRIYMDVGIKDEFGFARHYDNLVQTLETKGLTVEVQEGFGGGNCADLPDDDAQFRLVRYDAGHVGVAKVDPDDLLSGDVCGNDTVWQRLLSLLGYLNQAFPDGFKGPGGDAGGIGIDLDPKHFDFDVELPDPDLRGEILSATIDSPSLATAGGAGADARRVGVSSAGLSSHRPAVSRRVLPRRLRSEARGLRPHQSAARRAHPDRAAAEHVRRRAAGRRRTPGILLRQPRGAGESGAGHRAGDVGAVRGLDDRRSHPGDRRPAAGAAGATVIVRGVRRPLRGSPPASGRRARRSELRCFEIGKSRRAV